MKSSLTKSSLIKLALGAALTLASSLSFADRGRDRHDDDHRYRGDYRVEEPRRWNQRHFEYSGRHHRPQWHHQWRHHVHERWCAHQGPAVRHGPRFLGPRHSGFYGGAPFGNGGITLILRSDLN